MATPETCVSGVEKEDLVATALAAAFFTPMMMRFRRRIGLQPGMGRPTWRQAVPTFGGLLLTFLILMIISPMLAAPIPDGGTKKVPEIRTETTTALSPLGFATQLLNTAANLPKNGTVPVPTLPTAEDNQTNDPSDGDNNDGFECNDEDDPKCWEDGDYDIEVFLHATPVTFPFGTGPLECCKPEDFFEDKPKTPLVGFCMITSKGHCGEQHLLTASTVGQKICGKMGVKWTQAMNETTKCAQMPDYFFEADD